MLARSHIPLAAAILTLSVGATATFAVSLNFAKVQVDYRSQTDLDRAPTSGVSDGLVVTPTDGLPPAPPVLVFTQGLASWHDSTGTELRRRPVANLGSSGQDGVSVTFADSQPPAPSPTNPPFPALSFFDCFTEISIPTAGGGPSTNPSTLRRLEVHPLGSSGQDGIAIDFVVTWSNGGDEIPMEEIITPINPGVTFNGAPTVTTTVIPNVPPGTFSSFFDIFLELDANASYDPAQPMFRITTTLTPEPASLSLAALGLIPFLTRRRSIR